MTQLRIRRLLFGMALTFASGPLRLDGALVGQKQPCRAALHDDGRDGAGLDIGERLGDKDDARVLLAQGLEPFAQLRPEGRIVEGQPALIDDQQGGAAVEPAFDTME